MSLAWQNALTVGAACAPPSMAVLFDEGQPDPEVARQMRGLCFRCPVYQECLADTERGGPLVSGFRAGLTPQQYRAGRGRRRYEQRMEAQR